MSSDNRLPFYMPRMIKSGHNATKSLEGVSQDYFMQNDGKQISAGTYLQKMGLFANKITWDYCQFIQQHSNIPWLEISKMENGTVFDSDIHPKPHAIWKITKKRLPEISGKT